MQRRRMISRMTLFMPSLSLGRLDFEELRQAITPRTRAIILNTPHNPTGKVFSLAELQKLAEIVLVARLVPSSLTAQSYESLVVITDEVYEFIIFESSPLPRLATLPGMFERTLCVSSAGKMFSVTGWK